MNPLLTAFLRAMCTPAFVLAASLSMASPLSAQPTGSILLWPVNPVIEGDARAAALWLENPGELPITLQVQIYSWIQEDGRNVYANQEEILGSPPIVSIQPGERQLVRLTRIILIAIGYESSNKVRFLS